VLVERALADPQIVDALQRADAVHVVAVGKAARPMFSALSSATSVPLRSQLVVGPADAGHPLPDERSVAAAERALDVARLVAPRDLLLVLLSGGASSLMALPCSPLSLDAKQKTIRALLARGADITELNTVRRHLSAIKGGQFAAACRGSVLTLAISDVVGDDLAVIGSGPTVADPSTYQDALAVLDARGGRASYPQTVVSVLEHGAAGQSPETPKPGALWFMRSVARIVGSAADAVAGARAAASSLGYHVRVIDEPVVGDARTVAPAHLRKIAALAADAPRPLCVISSGETTVQVTGSGTGGRNQELALALALGLESLTGSVAAASVGTDGVDGPTDAAGAIVDTTTLARAGAQALEPEQYLSDNNTYAFFKALDDLIITGPTNTNVGDIQIVLIEGMETRG
jgi:hydroxypyruvate reductase